MTGSITGPRLHIPDDGWALVMVNGVAFHISCGVRDVRVVLYRDDGETYDLHLGQADFAIRGEPTVTT